MPLIEEIDDDDVEMVAERELDLEDLLKQLSIPSVYGRPEYISENPAPELEVWKRKAISILEDIRRIVGLKESRDLDLESRGDVVFAVVPFALDHVLEKEEWEMLRPSEGWMEEDTQVLAEDILSLWPFAPSPELVQTVLTHNLKPIFKASPHPHLNIETGRKLHSYAGGPMAMQDYYEGQVWKQYPGVGKVVLWCVRHVNEESYEHMWPLVIPPVMTLLDDYEARHKLQGVLIVQEMLKSVPKDLLKRTGIAGLLKQSLRTSLSHLQSPETPQLVRHAIDASLSLILLTTNIGPESKTPEERFDELSSLLGQGIITGIWLYAEDKPGVLHATFDSLPPLLRALDIGSARFLKSLVPQLAHSLIPLPLLAADRELQLSVVRVLKTLLDVCSPRISFWKETILDAVGRCWVGLIDEERKSPSPSTRDVKMRKKVKEELQIICRNLANMCPSVLQNEYPRFLKADKDLFENLLPQIDVCL